MVEGASQCAHFVLGAHHDLAREIAVGDFARFLHQMGDGAAHPLVKDGNEGRAEDKHHQESHDDADKPSPGNGAGIVGHGCHQHNFQIIHVEGSHHDIAVLTKGGALRHKKLRRFHRLLAQGCQFRLLFLGDLFLHVLGIVLGSQIVAIGADQEGIARLPHLDALDIAFQLVYVHIHGDDPGSLAVLGKGNRSGHHIGTRNIIMVRPYDHSLPRIRQGLGVVSFLLVVIALAGIAVVHEKIDAAPLPDEIGAEVGLALPVGIGYEPIAAAQHHLV